MPEEIEPEGLSDATVRNAPDEGGELIEEAERFRGRDVYDANGEYLGKVRKTFAEDGEVSFLQFTLEDGIKIRYRLDRDVGRIERDWVQSVDDEGLHLSVPAGQFLTGAPAANEAGDRGSSEFPRKER